MKEIIFKVFCKMEDTYSLYEVFLKYSDVKLLSHRHLKEQANLRNNNKGVGKDETRKKSYFTSGIEGGGRRRDRNSINLLKGLFLYEQCGSEYVSMVRRVVRDRGRKFGFTANELMGNLER
jgi:hypothetical protein